MTLREKQVVSAYTGFMMCDFSELHGYIEQLFNRPVFTHEMAFEDFQNEIKEKSKKEFLEICARVDEQ